MATAPRSLPQLGSRLFLTDGGIETTLIFHDGLQLPHFAAFVLLDDETGRAALVDYYERHIGIAKNAGVGFVLESPTWRASDDWGAKLGYSDSDMANFNRRAVGMMQDLRIVHENGSTPMAISGCIGPRGDGYVPGETMTAREAERYHGSQIRAFASAGADITTAITMTNAPEAIGIVRAAENAGIPVAISFTVETDGRLPTGQQLGEAIEEVDAETGSAAAYYMLNCAHPDHFADTLAPGTAWSQRVRGIRANASRRSHQELDDASDLDDGDPSELGEQYRALRRLHPQLTILGGCCGTDHRHIEKICASCASTS